MNPAVTQLVQESWAQVTPIATQAAALFYGNLFTLDPSLKTLFQGDMEEQGKRLMEMIGTAVQKLDNLETVVPVLQSLGKRHVRYGVKAEHYQTVGTALLTTLSQGLGEDFTPQVKEAWTLVYGVMADVMIKAAYQQA
jgi:hemoglobin-like flavoprotein